MTAPAGGLLKHARWRGQAALPCFALVEPS